MKNSHIEWTDHTFNPWEGCTKVSPGCAHCYAEAHNQRFSAGANWGKGAPRRRTSAQNWKQPLKWNKDAPLFLQCTQGCRFQSTENGLEDFCPGCGDPQADAVRPRVFCASLADWLDDEVPIEWLMDLLELIRSTPNIDWQLLTKRPQNWRDRIMDAMDRAGCNGNMGTKPGFDLFTWLCSWYDGRPPSNVWIGTTVEDQQRADERMDHLFAIPAYRRFISCEPLLSYVDLQLSERFLSKMQVIDWVICGGESGTDARAMHPDWARSLRDQCAVACVPFLFKQWGEWLPFPSLAQATQPGRVWGEDKKLCVLWPSGLKGSALMSDPTAAWENGCRGLDRVGKIKAGRLLDGKEHNEFPASAPSVSSP